MRAWVRYVKNLLAGAGRRAIANNITDLAAALAYYTFLAIPAVLLVTLGLFSLFASPDSITTLLDKFGKIVPSQTTELLDSSLRRMNANRSGSLVLTVVGLLLALWTTIGAMTAFIRATNRTYNVEETRGFVRQRLVALEMVVALGVAFIAVFGLLVLGPAISGWLGAGWAWWVLQWPILIVVLLLTNGTVLYLAPNVERPWRPVSPGAIVAAVIWLAASGLFSVYTSMFDSYNKTWGSLAGVIVMLVWLWLSGTALLFGAEINAEAERSPKVAVARAKLGPRAP
jgi:YihY family inner membrane protein